MLPHGSHHGMGIAGEIAQRLADAAVLLEFHDAAGIDIGKQPIVLGQPSRHALAHAGMAQCQIEARRAHAEPGHPIAAVGGAVDIVGIARHVADHAFDLPRLRPVEPIAMHAAGPGFGEEQRLPVMGDADAVGVAVIVEQGRGLAAARVVAEQPPGGPALDGIQRPVMGIVAGRGIREEDAPVRGDIAVVGIAQPRIVDDRGPGSRGLGGELGHLAIPERWNRAPWRRRRR